MFIVYDGELISCPAALAPQEQCDIGLFGEASLYILPPDVTAENYNRGIAVYK